MVTLSGIEAGVILTNKAFHIMCNKPRVHCCILSWTAALSIKTDPVQVIKF